MPQAVETVMGAGVMITVLRFDITEGGSEQGAWECDELEYAHTQPLTEKDYGPLVSAIIRGRYTADDMEALLNNYVSSKTAEHKSEWQQMQAWRATAKQVAREVISGVE